MKFDPFDEPKTKNMKTLNSTIKNEPKSRAQLFQRLLIVNIDLEEHRNLQVDYHEEIGEIIRSIDHLFEVITSDSHSLM